MPTATFLTTGVNSGLGKYIHEHSGGYGLSRETSCDEIEKIKSRGVDIIVHCAFNSARNIDARSMPGYLRDNIFLTKDLTLYPHKKFIFISSVDVYPDNGRVHSEDEVILTDPLSGIYAITKFMAESIVTSASENHLILRTSALLGKYSRRNSLIKLIEDDPCLLTVSADSSFNYVLHGDLLEFIRFAIKNDLKGIYNVTASSNISAREIANILGKKVTFGNFHYNTGNIVNRKASCCFPAFTKSSLEIIQQFLMERQ